MPLSLSDTLVLTPQGDALTAHLSGDYSNGRIDQPPEAGYPFGGLLAALCAQAMRQGLELKTRSLITVAMLTALGKSQELRGHVRGALHNGATVQEIQEVLLHASIYCGIPAAVEGFRAAAEIIDGPRA